MNFVQKLVARYNRNTYQLTEWGIFKLDAGEQYFYGIDYRTNDGRVSTSISSFDPTTMLGIDSYGNTYELIGPEGTEPTSVAVAELRAWTKNTGLTVYDIWFVDPFDLGVPDPTKYRTGTGQKLRNVHAENADCKKYGCAIHNPTDPNKDWPTHWRSDRKLMERICLKHGVGHPDRDDIAWKRRTYGDAFANAQAVHGCCGCCE